MALVIEAGGDEEEDLLNQIELEMRKIHLSVEKIHNNLNFSEAVDPMEKCLISYFSYSLLLTRRGISDSLDRQEDALKSLEDSLQKEIDYLTSDIGKVLKKMNEYKELYNSIDKNIANLNAMLEVAKTNSNSSKKADVLAKHTKTRFLKEKAGLKQIIFSLFSDNSDIQDLIARIIEHHFEEGPDKYLQLEETDDITEQIELLRRTALFDINPHDYLQIRLADLI